MVPPKTRPPLPNLLRKVLDNLDKGGNGVVNQDGDSVLSPEEQKLKEVYDEYEIQALLNLLAREEAKSVGRKTAEDLTKLGVKSGAEGMCDENSAQMRDGLLFIEMVEVAVKAGMVSKICTDLAMAFQDKKKVEIFDALKSTIIKKFYDLKCTTTGGEPDKSLKTLEGIMNCDDLIAGVKQQLSVKREELKTKKARFPTARFLIIFQEAMQDIIESQRSTAMERADLQQVSKTMGDTISKTISNNLLKKKNKKQRQKAKKRAERERGGGGGSDDSVVQEEDDNETDRSITPGEQ